MPFFIIVWCSFVLLGIVLKIYELEKDNFADLFPFLTLSVSNGHSVSFETNVPCNIYRITIKDHIVWIRRAGLVQF